MTPTGRAEAAAMRRLMQLRDAIRVEVDACLASGEMSKSYEGHIDVFMPTTMQGSSEEFMVRLHLYIFGPSRHYEWRGETLAEVVNAANADVRKWIRKSRRERTA